MCSLGFVHSINEPCLYTKAVNGNPVILAVYVDDIILAAKHEADVQFVKNSFSERFGIKDFGKMY